MKRKKSLGNKITGYLFIGYLPGLFVLLTLDILEQQKFSLTIINRDVLVASILLSPLFYFGIPYCLKICKEIFMLFNKASLLQKIILGIFAFLTFGRIIRLIIMTFKQSS